MVAEGVAAFPLNHTPYANSQLAITQSQLDMPKLPRWRPRGGRNDDFIKWMDALTAVENDLDIVIDEQQPSLEHIPPHILQHADQDTWPYIVKVTTQASQQWQHDSNLLFDIIKASLVLDGPHLERDLRAIAGFVSGKLKDARSLRAWALMFADQTSIDSQTSLRSDLNGMKIQEGATHDTLENHCRNYWATWSRIAGNNASDRASLDTFYVQFLATFPTQPEGSHLTNVRKWLADKITDSSPMLADVDDTIDKLLKYAKIIGVPVMKQPATIAAGRPGGGLPEGDGLHVIKESECDFCDCYACKSRKLGGNEFCLCRSDSKFDLSQSKLSEGTKAYVTKMRAYHKANPDVATLKGVKFNKSMAPLMAVIQEHCDVSAQEIDEWLLACDSGGMIVMPLMGAVPQDEPSIGARLRARKLGLDPPSSKKEYRAIVQDLPMPQGKVGGVRL